jgi:hypothetical protein
MLADVFLAELVDLPEERGADKMLRRLGTLLRCLHHDGGFVEER